MAVMIARQLARLRKKQLTPKGLSFDDVRQFKLLADALDDQLRLKRQLDIDLRREMEKLPDDKLEAEIAAGTIEVPRPPVESRVAPAPDAQKPRTKPKKAKP